MTTTSFSQTLKSNRGTVYGVILNDHDTLARIGASLSDLPYKAAPQAPVLYLKPANTINGDHAVVTLPPNATQVEIGATIGIVLAAPAAQLTRNNAASVIAGYVLVADLSLPHDSYYRPAVREKCFDGSCVLGDNMICTTSPEEVQKWELVTSINGRLAARRSLGDLVRDIPALLCDVSEFMRLQRGDVLLIGVSWQAPRAGVQDDITLSLYAPDAHELAAVHLQLAPGSVSAQETQTGIEPTPAPRGTRTFGRIFFNGAIHEVEPVPNPAELEATCIRLADGRILRENEAHWLPPVEPGTIFALGLNYADHARELAFKAPEQPLVFLKGPTALTGHYGQTRRPADATFMHYECELAVVIGKYARHVSREHAYDYVAGYTVANDYAIRDYLENYYRPNLRVKNRDACTPIGPWLVEAGAVADPMRLQLSTSVNGKVTQRGNTSDMVFDIPALIVYLSSIMTLAPGDIILTGTPEGLTNVVPGDCIVTEIEGIGRLVNTIVGDDATPAH
ncbi:4-hydroxyphenylacetate degradation bifunctional isomerase/decarboxylase decarboxylase subunit [Herbaspirillum sp. Sphag1AN]|nr:4-hydroxyphenylacetate degradation bifunctional isomerase/decarboxylase decarboxylase subunit [Herbaspirillum sp. Sphag1AN]MBB3244390.1 4-hydroxyphenylacetate degradation bifunctional isomerase/decarboxylase decarboxylase subunit [Herbaspirillum sp. Sphag64]